MRKAVEFLGSLAPPDLSMILFNFLAATMAKDVSVIFTVAALQSAHPSLEALPRPLNRVPANDGIVAQCLSVCTRQSSCGIFSITLPSTRDAHSTHGLFSVRAALVDLDCKPVAKLPTYERMDRDIVLHFLQQKGLGCVP
jgi:hypothetical protein